MTMLLAPPAPSVQSDEQLLSGVVDRLLACPSVGLPPAAALDRLRCVLMQAERLTAVAADGVRDLDTRELYALDGAGSATGWLRSLKVGGQTAPVTFARRIAGRPLVNAALAAGELGARAAEQLCAALGRVPERVDEQTVVAVLLDGVPDLLQQACGGGIDDDAERIASMLSGAAAATGLPPAQRLEPAFVALAGHLSPRQLTRALGCLLDALLPDEHLARHQQLHDSQYLDLHHLPSGGWHLSGLLAPEAGQLLEVALDRRLPPSTEGCAAGRGRADALHQLVIDAGNLSSEPGAGRGAGSEPQLTIIARLGAVSGAPGALPGQLADGTSLPRETLQRLGCGSALTAVLLDAAGHPVGASGTHRHATPRQRRALKAQWGERCAADGCDRPGTIPHHATPWWLAHHTQLSELVPLCTSSHHDLHEGGRTLRLRDGRYINPTGWTDGPSP